jgi:secondary thiamine-phosphate synthase enzyme
MSWLQQQIELAPRQRGFHLVTEEVLDKLPELHGVRTGLLHLFIQHTSASLSINENADADVPLDLEDTFSDLAPESRPYRHTCEGPDDMPAHVKASMIGCSLMIPISRGRLCLGTWQGIYLCEHRNRGGRRRMVATIWGEFDADGGG